MEHEINPNPAATVLPRVKSTVYRFEIRLPVIRGIVLRLHKSMLDLRAGKLVNMERALSEKPPGTEQV